MRVERPNRQARRRAAHHGPGPEVHDRTEWWSFHCAGCGEHTYVGRDPRIHLEDFARLCWRLYGDPPVCTGCQRDARQS